MRINKRYKELQDKIKNTPHDRLGKLKDSIIISDFHPQVKEVCIKEIDAILYRKSVALIEPSEDIDFD